MKVVLTGALAVAGIAVFVVPALAHGERVCREVSGFLAVLKHLRNCR
ncbi:MAG: hypothetical protein HFH84_18435 [Lachnospiraceae bacterium]|nr:hypothetical protein [Lachnospiraceae bacterium]